MGHLTLISILRATLALGGSAAGTFCVYAAFCNGQTNADGVGGIMFGIALASVVVVSWLMMPVADWRQRAGNSPPTHFPYLRIEETQA